MAETRRERDGDREVLAVRGDLTVNSIAALGEAFRQFLHTDANLVVLLEDAGGVDVSFLQLLCSAHRTAADRNRNLTVIGADREPVASLIRTAGFLRHIGCRDKTRMCCLWTEQPVHRGEEE